MWLARNQTQLSTVSKGNLQHRGFAQYMSTEPQTRLAYTDEYLGSLGQSCKVFWEAVKKPETADILCIRYVVKGQKVWCINGHATMISHQGWTMIHCQHLPDRIPCNLVRYGHGKRIVGMSWNADASISIYMNSRYTKAASSLQGDNIPSEAVIGIKHLYWQQNCHGCFQHNCFIRQIWWLYFSRIPSTCLSRHSISSQHYPNLSHRQLWHVQILCYSCVREVAKFVSNFLASNDRSGL